METNIKQETTDGKHQIVDSKLRGMGAKRAKVVCTISGVSRADLG
jgi:hypothetical protein